MTSCRLPLLLPPPFPPLPPPPNLASFRTTEIRTFIGTIIGALTQQLSLCVLSLCSFLKDYVLCHGTAPRHTTTYSNGTFPEVQQTLSRVWVFGGLGFWNLRLGAFPEGQLFAGFGIRGLGWRSQSMEDLRDGILERFSRISTHPSLIKFTLNPEFRNPKRDEGLGTNIEP